MGRKNQKNQFANLENDFSYSKKNKLNIKNLILITLLGYFTVKVFYKSDTTPPNITNNKSLITEQILNSGNQSIINFYHKFKIKLIEHDAGQLLINNFVLQYLNPTELQNTIHNFEISLHKLPPIMLQKLENLNFYLFKSIKNLKDDDALGGVFFLDNKDIYLIGGQNNILTLFHEIFHFLDKMDGFYNDDIIWNKINKKKLNNYKQYKLHGKNEFGSDSWKEIPGYARIMGRDYGPPDDQATICEQLLRNKKSLKHLLRRCKHDEILRKKVEIETGCKVDLKKGKFSNLLSLEEYQKISGFTEYQYFPKWSSDQNGKIWMDHNYWNKLMN